MNISLDLLINYGALFAYVAFSVDLIIQMLRVHKRRSSEDVSSIGTTARLVGCVVILLKFVATNDPYLMIGQTLFTFAVASYLFVILRYREK